MANMQKMQRNMAQLQEELAKTPVEGTAGGGVVKVTVNGANQMLAIELAPEVVDPDDIEMLQDLIMAATNEALRQMEEASASNMSSLAGGLGGGFPF